MMNTDKLDPKFKKQYQSMSEHSRNLLNRLIDECDIKSLKHTSTNTPDYRLFVNVGTKSKLNYCLIKLMTREDIIKFHLRTDGYRIIENQNIEVHKLEKHNYNGREWYEALLKSEDQIDSLIDYIVQVRNNHVKSL